MCLAKVTRQVQVLVGVKSRVGSTPIPDLTHFHQGHSAMRNIITPFIVAALLLVGFTSATLAVDDKAKSHEGTVVSVDVENNKLVMQADGDEHSHDIAKT